MEVPKKPDKRFLREVLGIARIAHGRENIAIDRVAQSGKRLVNDLLQFGDSIHPVARGAAPTQSRI
jgi:hypothetical protein